MKLIPPTRIALLYERSFCVILAGAVIVATACAAAGSPYPVCAALFLGALLLAGWMLTATFITILSSAPGLLCDPPRHDANFHALSKFPVQLSLDNPGWWLPMLFLQVDFTLGVGERALVSPPKFLGALWPRGSSLFEWEITARHRGEYQWRHVRARTKFPGSLCRREFVFSLSQKMLALPAIYHLDPKVHELLIGRRHAAGRLHFDSTAMEEFIGVRDYRPGDNPRIIHLGLSLRVPDYPMQLVVREFEDPTDDNVCVVLDTSIEKEAVDPDLFLYRHEKSLSFAVALCRRFAERQYRVQFLAADGNGPPIRLLIRHPARDLPLLEARLALIKPVADRSLVLGILDREARRSNAAVLLVSLLQVAEEKRNPRLPVLTITPDWQMSLVKQVVVEA